ncbi:hypothetical protein [Streptomyces sp. NPDC086010]|uniref:hypothetical protein n=1 Tax=Streptomyces sp. NPDC086010 TaxID=3365745 RepID=UPI0037D0FB6F
MTLMEQIARADERSLAASALACLDRCLTPPDDGGDPEPLRPLWVSCETGEQWAEHLDAVRAAMEGSAPAADDGTASRVRAMLGAAPREFAAGPLRTWADACSLLALDVHREFDFPAGDAGALERCRTGGAADGGPLVSGEVLRQTEILDVLAEYAGTAGGGAGLRQVLDLSAEGRRVLRAVMSRRARGRAR